MKRREFKDTMYDGLAKLLKAISNPYRLETIEMLSQGEKSVEGIVQTTNLTFANASQHLQVLKNNNIVKARKEKQSKDKEINAYCRGPFCVLADEAIKKLLKKHGHKSLN